MPPNVPWHIAHINIEADPATFVLQTREPKTAILIFFWKSGRPVGHRIVESQDDYPAPPTILEWAKALSERHPNILSSTAPAKSHRLSLIIPTRDRPTDLAHCLQSLRSQTRPPDETIVVDNG